jgi:hypothetical protein
VKLIDPFAAAVLRLLLHVTDTVRARADQTDPEGDRGDVPGWVMITLMTAIVVIGLLAIFQEQVIAAVRAAFNSITGSP